MIKIGKITALFLVTIFMIGTVCAQKTANDIFNNPPQSAKPRGYWIWGHGIYDYSRITEELDAFKNMGLGGVDIFDMGIADPYDIIPAGPAFFSNEMLDGITFAITEAKKRGLSMGLSVSNGWNAGGDWTADDEMLMRLLVWMDTITGPANISEIGFPEVPVTFQKPYGSFPLFPKIKQNGLPEFYQDVSLVAFPLNPKGIISDLKQVIYFHPEEIKGNNINIKLPPGTWVLARTAVTPLGQKMWMKSDNSNGFIMDHYSKKATKNHFNYITGRLTERLGYLGSTALERLYLCSFEAEDYIIWSPGLKDEFRKIHGYEIDQYMPVFTGQVIIDEETTRRILYDYRVVVSEMFVNNHYRQARDISNANGLLLASESGGPGPPLHYVPTEDLKALGSVDIMRGEFWNRKSEYFDENGNDLTQVVKNIASAAHTYGHEVVEMEAFTSHEKHWQERPLELKKLADKAFCEGMTRVVYHTMPHSPKEAGYPGWSYQAGTHISPKLTWWELSKPFHDYMARVSALLQEGKFVADVAYYYGEEIPKFASGSKFIRKTLGPGYEYDDLNKEVLLQAYVDGGKITLPTGMKYTMLVLPGSRKMSLEVLNKVEDLLNKGAIILGNKPDKVYGFKDFRTKEKELQILANKIWGNSNRKKQKIKYGKGMIYSGYSEKDILTELGRGPDFTFTSQSTANLDFIHRSTANEDIYFISNKDSAFVNFNADFRVTGKRPEIFNPSDGTIKRTGIFVDYGGRTILPLSLEPYGSVFVVFGSNEAGSKHVVEVEKDGKLFFSHNQAPEYSVSVLRQADNSLILNFGNSGSYQLKFNDGTTQEINYQSDKKFIMLDKPWDVRFPYGWGFNPVRKFEQLTDWTLNSDKELAIFSGSATYKTSFEIRKETPQKDLDWTLDLGIVGDVARVYLNGREVGTKVFPPFIFSIDDYIREGDNFLVVEVANTWLNQLIGESRKPFEQQRTSSNLSAGRSREFSARPWSSYKPLPSGLMGPVKIISEVQHIK
jgi:hypothetical protein